MYECTEGSEYGKLFTKYKTSESLQGLRLTSNTILLNMFVIKYV